ncbi:MAG: hypothetical protein ACM3SS_06570 [Rhodospirillaceae bacterium]
MKRLILMILMASCFAIAFTAQAKIQAPPSTPEQQAKAAEAKAKADEAAKKEAENLGKAQDRAADNYRKGKGKAVATAAAGPAKKK